MEKVKRNLDKNKTRTVWRLYCCRLNDRILNQDKSHYLDVTGSPLAGDITLTVESFSNLSHRDMTATIISRGVQYFVKKQYADKAAKVPPHIITHWVVTDLGTAGGRQLLAHALDQMVRMSVRLACNENCL